MLKSITAIDYDPKVEDHGFFADIFPDSPFLGHLWGLEEIGWPRCDSVTFNRADGTAKTWWIIYEDEDAKVS